MDCVYVCVCYGWSFNCIVFAGERAELLAEQIGSVHSSILIDDMVSEKREQSEREQARKPREICL